MVTPPRSSDAWFATPTSTAHSNNTSNTASNEEDHNIALQLELQRQQRLLLWQNQHGNDPRVVPPPSSSSSSSSQTMSSYQFKPHYSSTHSSMIMMSNPNQNPNSSSSSHLIGMPGLADPRAYSEVGPSNPTYIEQPIHQHYSAPPSANPNLRFGPTSQQITTPPSSTALSSSTQQHSGTSWQQPQQHHQHHHHPPPLQLQMMGEGQSKGQLEDIHSYGSPTLSTFSHHPPPLPSPTTSFHPAGLPSSWVDNFPSGNNTFFTDQARPATSIHSTTSPPPPPHMMTYHGRPLARGKSSPSVASNLSQSSGGEGMGSNYGYMTSPAIMEEEARRAAAMNAAAASAPPTGPMTSGSSMYPMYPTGLPHRGSYSGVSSAGTSSTSSSFSLSLGHPFPPNSANSSLSSSMFFDSSSAGVLGMPPPNPPPIDLHMPMEQETQRRAATACNFCRGRKLRCDGNAPCRQCARRDLVCVFSPSNPAKRKKRDDEEGDGTGSGKGTSPQENRSSGSLSKMGFRPTSSQGSSNEERSAWSARQRSSVPDINDLSFLKNTRETREEMDRKQRNRIDESVESTDNQSSDSHTVSNTSSTTSTPRAARQEAVGDSIGSSPILLVTDSIKEGEEGTAATNPFLTISPPSNTLSTDWWDHLIRFFGGSESSAIRIITSLLARFVQSNAIFFGLLHAPTLLEGIRNSEKRKEAYPALYFGVLSVAVCDLYNDRLEPWTADLEAAKGETKRLSLELARLGREYLFADLITRQGVSIAVGQAASILALMEAKDSSSQREYIRLLEGIVKSIDKVESLTIDSDSPLATPQEPSSEVYYQRPKSSLTSEAEIESETLNRLCWSSVSHWSRLVINRPDEDYGPGNELVTRLRPSAFWEPSKLPSVLSNEFYRSSDFMRAGKELSSIQHSVWSLCTDPNAIKATPMKKIESMFNQEEEVAGEEGLLEATVTELLIRLDRLEQAFTRYRYQDESEKGSVLANSADMLCRVLVATRMSLWRKTGSFSSISKNVQHLPNTIEYWFKEFVAAITLEIQQDTNRVQLGDESLISQSQMDSHLHHLRLANQIQIASRNHPIVKSATCKLVEVLNFHFEVGKSKAEGLYDANLQPLFDSTMAQWREVRSSA